MGDVLDYGEVVGDEQVGHAEIALQVGQQVDDLRLYRNIERGNGFVAYDQLGPKRQRARNHQPLPLPARKLVGKADHLVAAQADLFEQRNDLGVNLRFRPAAEVLHGLGDDVPRAHARVQRRVGILEHHLQILAMRPHVAA